MDTAAVEVDTAKVMRELLPGAVIANRFEIQRRAGSGGMATVYLAMDLQTGAGAAVKLLDCSGDPEKERFEREATLLAELLHPGIVRYIAHGRTGHGDPFLAMDWLEGEDLEERLARSALTVAESLALFHRVCEALSVAHRRGIVHRDIKPPNLFLPGGDPSRATLLDFGIARVTQAAVGITRTGITMGTPGYMAPEQVRGDRDLDGRADVYSLGCVLFRCLTGRAPFVGEHIMAILAKILLEDAPRVSESVPDISPELDDLVARMLCKEAAGRPADAGALLRECDELNAAAPGSRPRVSRNIAAPPSAPSALTRSEQRMICIVLVARTHGAPLATAPTALSTPGDNEQVLRNIAEPLGAHLQWMIDGSLVATISGAGSATDLASRAARCALALRAAIPDTPMALATGQAEVAGKIRLGDVIDRAARWSGRDQRTDYVRIDDVTARLLDVRFDILTEATALYLRGESELLEVTRTLVGKPSLCVGRDRELGMLDGIYAECVAESAARTVVVTAPAGVGKSRLRHEFLGRLRELDDQPEVMIGRGDPLSVNSSFSLIAQAIRRAAGIRPGDKLERQRKRLRFRLARCAEGEPFTRMLEFIGELAGVPFPDDDSLPLRAARNDPALMGHQMRAAWEAWLTAECRTRPLVIILEDMHWADPATASFVDGALRNLRDLPLMVVALARPEIRERFPTLWSERAITEIHLAMLSRKSCERLVYDVLGKDTPAKTVDLIVTRADGNAFYLEELIRAVHDGQGEALPETVLAMVQTRLDALEPEARRVLRAASVFGKTFSYLGVRALLGERTLMPRTSGFSATLGISTLPPMIAAPIKVDPVAEWLQQLAARELIESRLSPGATGQLEYSFRHALVRDAAYATLTDSDRALGHQLAGAWLEQAGERDAGVLAEHYDRAGEPAKAVNWYLRAAEQALEGNDLEGAIARAEKCVSRGAAGEMLGALRLVQAEAHNWRGKFADGEPCAAEAVERLEPRSRLWYRAVGELVTSRGRLAQYGRVAAWGRRLYAVPPTKDVAGAAVISGARAVTELLHAGRYDLADPLFAVIRELARKNTEHDPSAMGWVHRTAALRALSSSDPGDHLALMDRAKICFEQAGDPRNECLQRSEIGYAFVELGLFASAEECLLDVLASAEHMGLKFVAAAAKHYMGLVRAHQGRIDEALRLQQEAIEWFMTEGARRMEGAARSSLSQLLSRGGQHEAAEREARLGIAVLAVAAPLRAKALAVLSQALLGQNKAKEAHEVASEAFALLESLGGVERGEALVRLVHAEALEAVGMKDEAREVIRSARERVLRCSMTLDEPEWRDSYLSHVSANQRVLDLAQQWVGLRTSDGGHRLLQ